HFLSVDRNRIVKDRETRATTTAAATGHRDRLGARHGRPYGVGPPGSASARDGTIRSHHLGISGPCRSMICSQRWLRASPGTSAPDRSRPPGSATAGPPDGPGGGSALGLPDASPAAPAHGPKARQKEPIEGSPTPGADPPPSSSRHGAADRVSRTEPGSF